MVAGPVARPPEDTDTLVPLAARLPQPLSVRPGLEEDPTPRRSPVAPGDRLAGRYRLRDAVPGGAGGSAVLWHAHDEVLDRPVAVTVLPARSRTGAARPFLDAAARTGPVLAPGVARTLDADLEERPGRDGEPRIVAAYIISEWVEGQAMPALLADGPLPAVDAVDLVAQAAEALSAVHRAGLAHGRVTPAELLVTAEGRVRLTGTALSAVLHGESPREGAEGVADDTHALAEVLYAMLTARWPGDLARSGGLPPAPEAHGRPLSPRQVRAGVPRALDLVVRAALDPASAPSTPSPTDPQALAGAALAAVAERHEVRTVRPPRTRPRLPAPVRRVLPWALSVLLLVTVGIAGFRLGLDIGDLETEDGALGTVAPGGTALRNGGIPGEAGPLDLTSRGVTVSSEESPAEVPNAYDGDLGTSWTTASYPTPTFGGRAEGVGLTVDLGQRLGLSRVEAQLTAPGARVEIRAGDDPARLTTVAGPVDAREVLTLHPRGTAAGRYWQLWITRLPGAGTDFEVGVTEIRLVGA